MKKKKLIERLNGYFSAEEAATDIPPIETMQAYSHLHTLGETPAIRPAPARRSARNVRRFAVIAACLAVLIAVAVVLPAFIGKPENESNGFTTKDPADSRHPAASGTQAGLMDAPPEGAEPAESDTQEAPDGNGSGIGSGDAFEGYYPDELFDLRILSDIVTWDEIHAAEAKLLAENEYFYNKQLPALYLMVRELGVGKEAFARVNDGDYTDEQIEWLFSDTDIRTIQSALKLDTAFLYNGRLYDLYELLSSEPSQLRKMAGTGEMAAYLADLDAYLNDPALSGSEWKRLSDLVNELKAKLEQ